MLSLESCTIICGPGANNNLQLHSQLSPERIAVSVVPTEPPALAPPATPTPDDVM